MTSLLAGIDLSTRALHCALIPIDPDHGDPNCPSVTFRHVDLEQSLDAGIRFRAIREAVIELLWTAASTNDVVSCWVEAPRGPHAVRQLNAVYGAVMASIPLHITRNSLEPQEWRRELGFNPHLSKLSAVEHANWWLVEHAIDVHHTINDHQAEALLVALAGRQINHKAWAA